MTRPWTVPIREFFEFDSDRFDLPPVWLSAPSPGFVCEIAGCQTGLAPTRRRLQITQKEGRFVGSENLFGWRTDGERVSDVAHQQCSVSHKCSTSVCLVFSHPLSRCFPPLAVVCDVEVAGARPTVHGCWPALPPLPASPAAHSSRRGGCPRRRSATAAGWCWSTRSRRRGPSRGRSTCSRRRSASTNGSGPGALASLPLALLLWMCGFLGFPMNLRGFEVIN